MSIEVVKIQEFKGHSQAVYALAYDLVGRRIYSGSGDGMLVMWELHQPDGHLLARHPGSVYSLSVIGRRLLSGQRNGDLSVFDLESSQLVNSRSVCKGAIFDILEMDGDYLLACEDGYVRRLTPELQMVWETRVSSKSVRSLVVSKGKILTGTSDGTIVELNAEGVQIHVMKAHQGTVFSLAISPDGSHLYSGGKDAQLKMFENRGEIASIPAHLLHVHRLCINSDGDRLLSSSMDKTVKLWKTEGLELLKVIDFERHGGHTSSVNKILWIDKNTLISCSDDRTIKCFEIRER